MSTDNYSSPLSERYASKEMQHIFSQYMKFATWRKLWVALAETEMELGLKNEKGEPEITQEQIDEMKAHIYDINYDVAKEREKQVRHDVMSHVYAYGKQCPKAKGIIHIIHGFGEHSRSYLHMIVSFMEEDYIVCADDHVGHGKTAIETIHRVTGVILVSIL